MSKKKKILKKIFVILGITIIASIVINFVGGIIAYNLLFNRYERPDYKITPGIVCYEDVKENYPRQALSYSSGKEILAGYYYPHENEKALIIMSHGIHDGADSLLAQCLFFLDHNYSVFSYDNSGCFSSTGKANGFLQSVIDLKNTLDYLNQDIRFKNRKKLLFGFSWGGYATVSIFNFQTQDIYGSVSLSGYNDAENLIFNKGKSYVGPLAYTGKGIVELIQNVRFKGNEFYTGIDGINHTTTPFFIAHGHQDTTIRFKEDSILFNKNLITNPNVTYYESLDAGHSSLMYSNRANEYRKEVDAQLKSMKDYDDKVEYVKTIDNVIYSELSIDLFEKINEFYQICLK